MNRTHVGPPIARLQWKRTGGSTENQLHACETPGLVRLSVARSEANKAPKTAPKIAQKEPNVKFTEPKKEPNIKNVNNDPKLSLYPIKYCERKMNQAEFGCLAQLKILLLTKSIFFSLL